MLVFAAIGMAGFLLLLIVWLWILPEPERRGKRWLIAALLLTAVGIAGTLLSRP